MSISPAVADSGPAGPLPPGVVDEANFVCLATIPKSGTHFIRHFLVNWMLQKSDAGTAPLFSHEMTAYFPNVRSKYILGKVPYQTPAPWLAQFGMRDFVYQHGFANLEHFPGRLITVTRNPLDFIVSAYHYFHQSRLDPKFHLSSIDDIVVPRARFYAKMWRDLQQLKANGIDAFEMRYETLVADPQANFCALLDFLKMSWVAEDVEGMVEMVSSDAFRTAAIERKLNPNFVVPISRNGRVGQWRTELSDHHIAQVRGVFDEFDISFEDAMGSAI